MVKKKTASKRVKTKTDVQKKISQELHEIEERVYGLKEMIHGIVIGLVIGFIFGVILFKGGL
jgi:F0F1-type ATP synthase assembly protein I